VIDQCKDMTATRAQRTVGINDSPTGSATSVDFVPPGRRWSRLRTRLALSRLDFIGLATAVCFFCLSLTPSLLPRPWYLQGVVSGILTATGYAVGVAVAWTVRHVVRWPAARRIGPDGARLAWRILFCTGAVLSVVSLVQGSRWQRDIHLLMGQPPPAVIGYLGVPVITVGIFAPLVALARLLRASARALGRLFGRWIPPAAARVAAVAGVTALVVLLLQGLVANGLMAAANAGFGSLNTGTAVGVTRPASPAVSGSPDSLVPWASLGRWGRDFVATAPSVADLSRFTGRPATPPIRVYVGLDSAPTLRDQAALAIRELQRTSAFDRAVLCVITTTGTGWVDRRSVVPLEYMYGGDSALVAIQYSFLPSALSFVADRDRVRRAGRELFDQVYAYRSRLPADHRPKLLVFGESLGSWGAESAFSGVADLRNRTDGALLVGPPNSSGLWGEFVSRRDRGTSQILPIFQHGESVRFAGRPTDLATPSSFWSTPHVVYLQHASDPVVWWSPRLILHRPDWLAERRGHDVLPAMRWYPFVTFWQLTADLVLANKAPPGHGHDYHGEAIDAWAQIVPPPGWTAGRTAALRARLGPH
jgi:uncharacterized membrane protein